jgi:hypothetical protein
MPPKTVALMDNKRAVDYLRLYLGEKFWGADARVKIAAQMEYRGYSPL